MTILVTGASGTVGRHVVDGLVKAGEPVRALTRDPSGKTFPDGVEVAVGDLARPETLAGVFDGVDRMYLFPVAQTAREVVNLAKRAGTGHIVVLSSSAVEEIDDEAEPHLGYQVHRPVERAAEESGLPWTHVRGGEFTANVLGWWAEAIRAEGVVRDINGDLPMAPVHEADVAEVAVAALTEDGHAGEAYTVTGPEPITRREQVRVIGAALGRDLRFEQLSLDQARELWISQGMPEEAADYLLWEPEEGDLTFDPVSPDFERALGRRGRTFAQWVADHLDAFR